MRGRDFLYCGPLMRGCQGSSRDFLYYRLRRAGKQGLSRTFSVYPGVRSFTPSAGGRRSLPGAAWRRGRACDFDWEIAILFWVIPFVGETPAVPGYFQGCPTPRMDSPHVECGKWRRLLVAASGRAAPISRWTSGRAARGGVCAGPDLLLPAIRASL